MEINYKDGVVTNKSVTFEGETKDGQGFTIYANWNDWDNWSVDDVTWHNPDYEPTDEEVEVIKKKFLVDMN
jgi:hypothetical protein